MKVHGPHGVGTPLARCAIPFVVSKSAPGVRNRKFACCHCDLLPTGATYWAATGPIHLILIHRPPCSNGQARLRRSRLAASRSTRSAADVRIRASDPRGLPASNPLFVNAAFAIHLNRRRDGSYRSCPLTTLDRRRVPKEHRERRSKVTPHMETIARDVWHAEDGADRSLPSPIPSVRGQRSARIPPGRHWRR